MVNVWLPLDRLTLLATGLPLAVSAICPRLSLFTGSLNCTVNCALIGTPVTPFAGLTFVTCGALALAE